MYDAYVSDITDIMFILTFLNTSLESTALIEKDEIGRFRKDNDDGLRPETRR